MNALNVISLETAKINLVVDYPDRDLEITGLIKAAVASIEKYTNVMLYERNKTYKIDGCSLEVYDFPLTISTTGLKIKENVLSTTIYGSNGTSISAKVGFTSVPDDYLPLVEACNKYITYLYENKDAYSSSLPIDIQLMLNQFRRSATI